MKILLFSLIFLALGAGYAPSAHAQQGLCFRDIDCGDGYVCVGATEDTRGVCRNPATQPEAPSGILENPIESDDLIELLLTVLRGIVRIAAIFLVFVFVWIGFQFAAAQGNEEKLRTARTALMWSVIGAAILLGAETLADIIIATGSSIY